MKTIKVTELWKSNIKQFNRPPCYYISMKDHERFIFEMMCTYESCTLKPETFIRKVNFTLCLLAIMHYAIDHLKASILCVTQNESKLSKLLPNLKTTTVCQSFTKISLTVSSLAHNSKPGDLGRVINNGKVHFHLVRPMGWREKGRVWMSEWTSAG